MIVELHTWRYTQELAVQFHGNGYRYDPGTATLVVYGAVQKNGDVALEHVVTITQGDDFVVLQCDQSCVMKSHHAVSTGTVFP
jgi:hypothetical protein